MGRGGGMKAKESCSFFEKKEPKKLLAWGHGTWRGQRPLGAKVFLVLFFQKKNCFS
jgi:hypothetical protein